MTALPKRKAAPGSKASAVEPKEQKMCRQNSPIIQVATMDHGRRQAGPADIFRFFIERPGTASAKIARG